jgi:hypothetical protein
MDAHRVALLVRLFRLLANRHEFRTPDAARRIDAAWTSSSPGSLPVLDRWLITQATELDQMCGYTVAKLRKTASAPVLDVLGVLDPERIVAMYYVLPERRRSAVLRDGVWAYHVGHADLDAVAEALADWDEMPDLLVPDDMPHEAQAEIQDFTREAQRYRAGLSHELTPEQVEIVHRSTHRSRAVFAGLVNQTQEK